MGGRRGGLINDRGMMAYAEEVEAAFNADPRVRMSLADEIRAALDDERPRRSDRQHRIHRIHRFADAVDAKATV